MTTEDIRARSIKGFCSAYGIGKSKTYELIAAGVLKTVKFGTRTLILEDSARAWLANLAIHDPIHKSADGERAEWKARR